MTEKLLTINDYSRPGRKLKSVLGVVLHWTANPGVSAESNRDFFESRKEGNLGAGSAHYVIGLFGEVIRCIPEDEMAYHCGSSQPDPVSRLIYTDRARYLFGDYAAEHIDLIRTGSRDQEIGVFHTRLFLNGVACTVSAHGNNVQGVGDHGETFAVSIDHRYVMIFGGKLRRECAADLTAAYNNDIHTKPFQICFIASA